MQRYNINNRLAYLSGGVQSAGGMWPSVAAGDWWDPGGSYTAVAAWQGKGAASQAASYSNLVNPGTYDLGQYSSDAVPAWTSAAGWTFDGTLKTLVSSASANLKPVTYIARVKPSGTTNYRTIIASRINRTGWLLDLTPTTNQTRFVKMALAEIAVSTSGFSGGADSVVALTYDASGNYVFYLNGSANGSGTNNTTAGAGPIILGVNARDAGIPANYYLFNGDIMAIAVYSTVLDSTQIATVSTAMAAI